MNSWQRAAYNLLYQAEQDGRVKTHHLNLPPETRSGRPAGHTESPEVRAKRRVNKNFASGFSV